MGLCYSSAHVAQEPGYSLQRQRVRAESSATKAVSGEVSEDDARRQCCKFQNSAGIGSARHPYFGLGGKPEQPSDEPNLSPNIIAAHPSSLPLANHVYRIISVNRSPSGVKFPEALLARWCCSSIGRVDDDIGNEESHRS
jgi:hypothetical protein